MSNAQTKNRAQDSTSAASTGGQVAVIEPRIAMPAEAANYQIDKSKWRVLVEATFPAAKSAAAVIMALEYCQARNLDIFKRVVHIVPMWSTQKKDYVETVWPGIAEIRTTAFRTGQFAGLDAIEWGPVIEQEFSIEKDVWENGRKTGVRIEKRLVRFHEWARMTVYRVVSGLATPARFIGPQVFWVEICAKDKNGSPNDRWLGNPNGQHEKTAEAAALRRAFPEELGNEYSAEEMDGQVIDGQVIDRKISEPTVAPPPPPPPPATSPKAAPVQGEVLPPKPKVTESDLASIKSHFNACKTEEDAVKTWEDKVRPIFSLLTEEQKKEIKTFVIDLKGSLTAKVVSPQPSVDPNVRAQELADLFDAAAERTQIVDQLDELWADMVVKHEREGILEPEQVSALFTPIYEAHRERIESEGFPGGASG